MAIEPLPKIKERESLLKLEEIDINNLAPENIKARFWI